MLNSSLALPCCQTLSNRLAKFATREGLANARGLPSAPLETLYRWWSLCGAELLISGGVMIDRLHMERPGDVVVEGRAGLDALKTSAAAGIQWQSFLDADQSSGPANSPGLTSPTGSVRVD
jgi:2,4-dienoyl-CoA reductase-like NADH-dependent reductase (Old Yellow Enzyme family)